MGRADLHTHTKHSGLGVFPVLGFYYPESATEPEDLVRESERKGLDLICITDHNTINGALKVRNKKDVVVGEEITTLDGELIGLFLNEEIKPQLSAVETIERIHEQGGIAVAPHPYSVICNSLGDLAFSMDIDGIEIFNAYHRDGYSNKIAQTESAEANKAFVGGSDAHYTEMVGNGYTVFDGVDSDDLYQALKKKSTEAAGNITPLRQGIRWSVCITEYGLRALLGENTELHVEKTALKKKIAGVLGGAIFLLPPVVIGCSLLSDVIVKRMGERMWANFTRKNIYSNKYNKN